MATPSRLSSLDQVEQLADVGRAATARSARRERGLSDAWRARAAISTTWRCASDNSPTRLLIGMRSSSVAIRASMRSASAAPPGSRQRRRRQLKIFQHRQIGRQRRMLIHDRDAVLAHLPRIGRADVLAVVVDGAGIGVQHAGSDADQRRFAGAVLADDGVNLAGHDQHVDAFERLHRPETLAHVRQASSPAHAPWSATIAVPTNVMHSAAAGLFREARRRPAR